MACSIGEEGRVGRAQVLSCLRAPEQPQRAMQVYVVENSAISTVRETTTPTRPRQRDGDDANDQTRASLRTTAARGHRGRRQIPARNTPVSDPRQQQVTSSFTLLPRPEQGGRTTRLSAWSIAACTWARVLEHRALFEVHPDPHHRLLPLGVAAQWPLPLSRQRSGASNSRAIREARPRRQ